MGNVSAIWDLFTLNKQRAPLGNANTPPVNFKSFFTTSCYGNEFLHMKSRMLFVLWQHQNMFIEGYPCLPLYAITEWNLHWTWIDLIYFIVHLPTSFYLLFHLCLRYFYWKFMATSLGWFQLSSFPSKQLLKTHSLFKFINSNF